MSTTPKPPDRSYADLTRDQLAARLRVAEDALVLLGWCATPDSTQRGKAALQAWMNWCDFIGGSAMVGPKQHPYLVAIEEQLAANRDRVERDFLERFDPDAESGRG